MDIPRPGMKRGPGRNVTDKGGFYFCKSLLSWLYSPKVPINTSAFVTHASNVEINNLELGNLLSYYYGKDSIHSMKKSSIWIW